MQSQKNLFCAKNVSRIYTCLNFEFENTYTSSVYICFYQQLLKIITMPKKHLEEFREFVSSSSQVPQNGAKRGPSLWPYQVVTFPLPTNMGQCSATRLRIPSASVPSRSFLSKLRSLRTLAVAVILPLYLKSSRPEGLLIPILYIKTMLEFRNLFNLNDFQFYTLPALHSHLYLIFVTSSSSRLFNAKSSFLTHILPCSPHALIPG